MSLYDLIAMSEKLTAIEKKQISVIISRYVPFDKIPNKEIVKSAPKQKKGTLKGPFNF